MKGTCVVVSHDHASQYTHQVVAQPSNILFSLGTHHSDLRHCQGFSMKQAKRFPPIMAHSPLSIMARLTSQKSLGSRALSTSYVHTWHTFTNEYAWATMSIHSGRRMWYLTPQFKRFCTRFLKLLVSVVPAAGDMKETITGTQLCCWDTVQNVNSPKLTPTRIPHPQFHK